MSARLALHSILLVEDDRRTRDLFALRLKAAGLRVTVVGDGLDALRRIEGARPSLIVLDLGLPMLDGRDVQRELSARADTRHIPIVVVTGADPSGLDQSSVACVLRKPVDPDVLVASVVRCLDNAPGPEAV